MSETFYVSSIHAGLCCLSHSSNASLTRDCQPWPVARKAERTLSSRRSDTGAFRGAFWGPRTRGGMSGCDVVTGFIPERKEPESAGDSTASQSSWVILSGLRFFIIFSLSFISPAQANEENCVATAGVDKRVKTSTNTTKGHPTIFAIVDTIVLGLKGCLPLKAFSFGKVNAMLGKVSDPFTFIPIVLHDFIVYTK